LASGKWKDTTDWSVRVRRFIAGETDTIVRKASSRDEARKIATEYLRDGYDDAWISQK
jgi:hypothetical protein